jgi:MerR family mercuric resistance operon transcriptional regulator
MARMTIGELARRGGVGVETVRYYQRRKLIPEPPRRPRGFRQYTDETLRALRFIRRAKGLGFKLREIARMMSMRTSRSAETDLVDVLLTKVTDLEREVDDLQLAIRVLKRLADRMEGLPPDARWKLLEPDGEDDST